MKTIIAYQVQIQDVVTERAADQVRLASPIKFRIIVDPTATFPVEEDKPRSVVVERCESDSLGNDRWMDITVPAMQGEIFQHVLAQLLAFPPPSRDATRDGRLIDAGLIRVSPTGALLR